MEKGLVQNKRQLYVCCPACGKTVMIALHADAEIKHTCGKTIHVISDGNSVNTTIIEDNKGNVEVDIERCDLESKNKRIGAYAKKINAG